MDHKAYILAAYLAGFLILKGLYLWVVMKRFQSIKLKSELDEVKS